MNESYPGEPPAPRRGCGAGGDASSGRVTIAPEVLVTIARLTTQSLEGVAQMCHQIGPGNLDRLLGRVAGGGGVQIAIVDDAVRVDLYIVVEPDTNMRSVSQKIQEAVTRAIRDMVGMKVSAVNIHIQDVAYNKRSS
jgi:uncharacterized alkaline shock family protein YloU